MKLLNAMLAASAVLAGTSIATTASAATPITVATGDTVTCTGLILSCSPATAKIGAGTEFTYASGNIGFNFSDNLLTISNLSQGGYTFIGQFGASFTDLTAPFTKATLGTVSNVTWIAQSDITLTDGVVKVNFDKLSFNKGGSFQVQLASVAAVPEPASWALMIGGFGLVGGAMRRRTSKFRTAVTFA